MRRLPPTSRMMELIERIYAAGCDPSEWAAFAEAARATLPGTSFSIHLSLQGTTLGTHSTNAGLAPEALESYFAHYQFENPYIALFQAFEPGKVRRLSGIVPPEEVKKLPFYSEWLKPAGDFTYGAGVTLLRDERRLLHVVFDVPDRFPDLEGSADHLLSALGAHLTRAFIVSDHLAGASLGQQALLGLIAQIDGAAAVMRSDGRILAANPRIEQFARDGTLLRIRTDMRIAFTHPRHEQAFQKALASIANPLSAGAPAVMRVTCAIRGDCTVMVLPIRAPTGIASVGTTGTLALVLIRPTSDQPLVAPQLLRSVYGLSRAEADVATLIAAGKNAAEIADDLGVSNVTVRNQIAAVMGKMDVRRQAEVVAAVAALAPRLKPETDKV